MKLCEKCGAINADDRFFCVDCDTKLGDPLSDTQEAAMERQLDDTLEKQYDKTDALHVSWFDKLMAAFSGVGAVTHIVLLIVHAPKHTLPEGWGYATLLCLLLSAATILDCLCPRLGWELTRHRTSMWANGADELTPNTVYLHGRRTGVIVCLVAGTILLAIFWTTGGGI
ncbi:MAG: hypothetical protein IJZ13_08910 [Clostridia bacterium]|nr:hypothetical protein [Clostridia bacterium]